MYPRPLRASLFSFAKQVLALKRTKEAKECTGLSWCGRQQAGPLPHHGGEGLSQPSLGSSSFRAPLAASGSQEPFAKLGTSDGSDTGGQTF